MEITAHDPVLDIKNDPGREKRAIWSSRIPFDNQANTRGNGPRWEGSYVLGSEGGDKMETFPFGVSYLFPGTAIQVQLATVATDVAMVLL